MGRKLQLDLSIAQRDLLISVIYSQRGKLEDLSKGSEILKSVQFTDDEADEIGYIRPRGAAMGMWNQNAEKQYTIVIRGRMLVSWLTDAVKRITMWRMEDYEAVFGLTKQFGIHTPDDDWEDDDNDEPADE